jgi:hypothetical protein
MDEMRYAKLTEVLGRGKAEILESFLEAEGIDVELIQDSLSHSSYTLAFAPVQVFVPKEKLDQARERLKVFDESFEKDDEQEDEEIEED